MSNNRWLVIFSICLIFAAIYFHNGYFKLVNEVIYSDAAIPADFQADKLYFMAEKLRWKKYTIYSLWLISLAVLVYHWLLPSTKKWIGAIVSFQFVCCSIALILWMVMPKGMIFF